MTDKLLEPISIPNLRPQEIVDYLDRHIIGQDDAKRSIAVAIRNRYRRSKLSKELQDEIAPSNLIMMGPTGVGKTEIVRRISKILGVPFIKVEATKYTEVGYVGRDVESMIRDLVETSMRLVHQHKIEQVHDEAVKMADDRLLDILVPKKRLKNRSSGSNPIEFLFGSNDTNGSLTAETPEEVKHREDQRHIFREKLRRSELEDEIVEIEVEESALSSDFLAQTGMDQVMDNMNDLMKQMIPGKKKKRRVTIAEAREILTEQESEKLIDNDQVAQEAIRLAENHGIIFIDEIDKIAESNRGGSSPGVSREGVQRDILPIVEGSVVKTKHGTVRTDHMLFIAAGAFHVSKPEDLIPELQGRFPVKVRLKSLTEKDFVRILTEPDYSLIEQYCAILSVDNCKLDITDEAVQEIAHIAYLMNDTDEDLGARRLVTVLEALFRDLLFHAGEEERQLTIDRNYVDAMLSHLVHEHDISKYVL